MAKVEGSALKGHSHRAIDALAALEDRANASSVWTMELDPPPRPVPRRKRAFIMPNQIAPQGPPPPDAEVVLDGFVLLEACRVEDPDEAEKAVLEGCAITEDLSFFKKLTHLDLGDNRVQFAALAYLPVLIELHLDCNGLISLSCPAGGFPCLEVLNLSYNGLAPEAISALADIPHLRQLDLSKNELTSLPADLSAFAVLQSLNCEHNLLGLESSWLALGSIPNLRSLSLGHNRVDGLPPRAVADIPEPEGFEVSFSALRLTSPDDDATAEPISLPTETNLSVVVSFSDNTTREFAADPRVHYRIHEPECATLDRRTLHVTSGALCPNVTVGVELSLPMKTDAWGNTAILEMATNVTVTVAYLDHVEVFFNGYPDTAANQQVIVTSLSLIQCTNKYHQATARANAYLTDKLWEAVSIASYTTFSSSDASKINTFGSRMLVFNPGSVTITGTFGSTSAGIGTVQLASTDSIPNRVVALNLSTELREESTLSLVTNTKQEVTIGVIYENGIVFEDLGASAGGLGVQVSDIVEFGSSVPSAIAIGFMDGLYQVQQLANWEVPVALNLTLSCNSSVVGELEVHSNVRPVEQDLDLGFETGLMYQQRGNLLDVPVRIRTPDNQRLINFQVVVTFDTDYLTSVTMGGADANASYLEGTGSSAWPGVMETLNEPADRFQLAGSELASNLEGLVDLGTVTLNVVGEGVTFIDATIVELITLNAANEKTRVTNVAAVAGAGYGGWQARPARRVGEHEPDPRQPRQHLNEAGHQHAGGAGREVDALRSLSRL